MLRRRGRLTATSRTLGARVRAPRFKRSFGVTYHPGHVWKVMRRLGWSLQRPTTRARERDEPAIARWSREDWPRLERGGGTLIFLDESGFSECPPVRRTCAPKGETPVVVSRGRSWERIAAIGALA